MFWMLTPPGYKTCSLSFLHKILNQLRNKSSLVRLLEQTAPSHFDLLSNEHNSTEVKHGPSAIIFATKKQTERMKGGGKESAVLVALVDLPVYDALASENDDLEPWVVFTLRSSHLRAHPGEISFPGGKVESQVAESSEQAALRETREEIGIPEEAVKVLGHLRPVLTRSGKSIVTPVVGILENEQNMIMKLQPKTDEVHTIFVSPLSELVSTIGHTTFRHDKYTYDLPVFFTTQYRVISSVGNKQKLPKKVRIWGLSAAILYEALRTIIPKEVFSSSNFY